MDFFESPVFKQIIDAVESMQVQSVVFDNTSNAAVNCVQSGSWYSRRSVVYDLPLYQETIQNEQIERMLDTLVRFSKDSIYTEIRMLNNRLGKRFPVLHKYHFQWQDWLNIFVKTRNSESVWAKIPDSRKRQINASLNAGVELIEAKNINEVEEFYRILKKLYRERIHKPLPDWSFFQSFFNHTADTKWGTILLARFKGEVIAGMICPITPGEIIYEWFVAGKDEQFKGTGIYPSTIITWSALKYAYEHQIPMFNFMGAGYPGKPFGVRDFKMQFGGELVNVGRYIRVNKPLFYQLGKLYFNIREVV